MSGGSLDYICFKVSDAAEEIRESSENPLYIAFADHLDKVAKALHDVEWVLGRYVVTENGPKYVVIFFPPTGLITSLNPNPSLDAAKAAAEADWQARIKEALEPVPSGWISVEERLPEGWEDALITNRESVWKGYHNYGTWFNSNGDPFDPEEITHWQPMPEPPKEEHP